MVGHGCCKPTGAITNTIAEYIVLVEMETHDVIFARLALAFERAGPIGLVSRALRKAAAAGLGLGCVCG